MYYMTLPKHQFSALTQFLLGLMSSNLPVLRRASYRDTGMILGVGVTMQSVFPESDLRGMSSQQLSAGAYRLRGGSRKT